MAVTHGGEIFAAARASGRNWRDILDFSASINPLGPAPDVRCAIIDAIDQIVHYPDPYATRLTAALAAHWNVEPEAILTGNGATDLIHFVARMWPQERTALVVPTFSEFHRAYPKAEHVTESWPDDGLLILTNPNNPTGQISHIPKRRGPTLVDESFLEFAEEPSNSSATLRLRSLTKFHAIPGLRVGALIGPPDLMRTLRAKREPWTVNVLAEAALLTSLNDPAHAGKTREFVRREGNRLFELMSQLERVHPLQPTANYVFAGLDYPASSLRRYLAAQGILIRDCTDMPGIRHQAVRVAVRRPEENDRLIRTWQAFVDYGGQQ